MLAVVDLIKLRLNGMKGIRMMDIKKLTEILIGIGILVIAVAFIWWATFYTQVTGARSSLPMDALRCLYSSGGPCGVIVGIARLSGGTPYNPTLFWVGIIVLGVGLILKYSLKEEIPPGNNKEDILKK